MNRVNRREFLRTVAAAGVELTLAGSALADAKSVPKEPARHKKVVVAGAGI
jgi:hypothetical protein